MSHAFTSRPSPRLVAAILCLGLAVCATASAQQRPNIVLLMGDDHGWDETSYNGHPHLQTPVLDDMAASGLRLDHFYSGHPTCSPTRGSFMTGRHPNRYGTFGANYSIRPEEISIAQILSKAGYACGHFGKWHLGPVKADSPTNPGAMGFDEWLSHDNFFEMNPVLSRNGGPPQQFEGESSEILIEETIRFIGKANQREQPFLAVVWFGSPHQPYSGLAKDLARYEDLPESYSQQQVGVTSMETGRPTKRPLDQVLQERYAEITAMDRAIGGLRQWLENESLRQDTLIWYCGDNGSPSGASITSPFRGQKAQMYEGGIRVPGIIEWPQRIPQPRVSKLNAVTSDILPTLCDLLDLTRPDRPIDGVSLQPLIDGEMTERTKPICFWNFNRRNQSSDKPYIDPELQKGTTPLVKMMGGRFTRNFRNFHHPDVTERDYEGPRVILKGPYKLVVREQGDGELKRELFNLSDDAAEQNNLVDEKRKVAADLQRQLQDWQDSVLKSLTGADYE